MTYAYASARIRALETNMLDSARIDRMIEAESANEALKVLSEDAYGYSSNDIRDAHGYEVLLKEELKKVYDLLKHIAPDPQVFDLFLQRNDYHNIKVLLKAEFIGEENDGLLIEAGTIPTGKLKVMISDRNMGEMPLEMKQAIEKCLDVYQRTQDPQMIDVILDKASYSQMKQMAKNCKIDFIIKLVETMIDLENIKTFLRVKRLNKAWDFLSKVLLPGGSIKEQFYIERLEGTLESFIDDIQRTPYAAIAEEGILVYKDTGSLTKLEKRSDDFIMAYIKKARYTFLGIEPLVSYLLAKENEIKIARIVMVGKINRIAKETIRERLRDVYV